MIPLSKLTKSELIFLIKKHDNQNNFTLIQAESAQIRYQWKMLIREEAALLEEIESIGVSIEKLKILRHKRNSIWKKYKKLIRREEKQKIEELCYQKILTK